MIVGIRPENFEDAALVSADNRPHGITFRADHRRPGVAGLRRVRLLHAGARAGGELRRTRGAGRGTPGARTPAAAARPSSPGSTPPPGSARARTPSSGWTPGRCTSSTRPPAATCRWRGDDGGAASVQAAHGPGRRRRAAGSCPGRRRVQATSRRFPARPARPGRLPDLSPQPLARPTVRRWQGSTASSESPG